MVHLLVISLQKHNLQLCLNKNFFRANLIPHLLSCIIMNPLCLCSPRPGCLRHVRLRCRGAEQSTGAVTPHIVNTGGTHCTSTSPGCSSLISQVMEQKCLKSSNFCPPHTKTRQLQWRLLVKFPSLLVTGGRKLSSSIYQSMPLSGHNCHTLYGPWWILI